MARPGDRIVSICLDRVSFETIDKGTNREGESHPRFHGIGSGEAMTSRQGEAIRADCK
jgi:hypothetical protein